MHRINKTIKNAELEKEQARKEAVEAFRRKPYYVTRKGGHQSDKHKGRE